MLLSTPLITPGFLAVIAVAKVVGVFKLWILRRIVPRSRSSAEARAEQQSAHGEDQWCDQRAGSNPGSEPSPRSVPTSDPLERHGQHEQDRSGVAPPRLRGGTARRMDEDGTQEEDQGSDGPGRDACHQNLQGAHAAAGGDGRAQQGQPQEGRPDQVCGRRVPDRGHLQRHDRNDAAEGHGEDHGTDHTRGVRRDGLRKVRFAHLPRCVEHGNQLYVEWARQTEMEGDVSIYLKRFIRWVKDHAETEEINATRKVTPKAKAKPSPKSKGPPKGLPSGDPRGSTEFEFYQSGCGGLDSCGCAAGPRSPGDEGRRRGRNHASWWHATRR